MMLKYDNPGLTKWKISLAQSDGWGGFTRWQKKGRTP